jgi:4-aminobutyrate aminotransferase-like enzyme
LPGPRSRALRAAEAPFLAPGIQQLSTLSGLVMVRGEGALLYDADGNRFIDFVAGIGTASIGHGHPALAAALAEQAALLCSGSFTSAPRVELLTRIAHHAPTPELQCVQLYSGGAEAVESALRLARAVTGRYEVLAFWGGFHGKTGGVLGLLGSDFKHGLGPGMPGQHLVPYADCVRCPFQLRPDSCGLACVEFLRQFIRHNTTGSLAAILVEPIQGTAGNIIPPPGFLPAVQTVAREHGALLIVDEMITGWGRTGSLWASPAAGLLPDIITFGKGFGGGFPVSGLLTRRELAAAEPWSRPSFSSSSYGGNPLAAAAANATTRVIIEQQLAAHAQVLGRELLAELQALAARFPVVANVRGQGLLLGFDLVAADGTPLPRERCEQLFAGCLRRGLLTLSYAPRVRINPPLVLSREQALEGVALLGEALAEL